MQETLYSLLDRYVQRVGEQRARAKLMMLVGVHAIDEFNPVAMWMNACMIKAPGMQIDSGRAYEMYSAWAKAEDVAAPISRKKFGMWLRDTGLVCRVSSRTPSGSVYRGIGLPKS